MFRFLCLVWLLLGVSAPGAAIELRPTGAALGIVRASELPPEAQTTLSLIRREGPFPYERDGVVFKNFERILPRAERGYYREYTVKTPGERSRGARRIVAGGQPPTVFYYTADHYKSFRRIEE